ncbi:hypothetical protein QFC22_002306 [Naganishia vaughanmartiniae]|uniref:Uncharacterized protein n=1 Tax=Naganishia vaughanmartiniae TaxID=1424756 RepID=A0ACC2XDG5_9TREE|nr:hypothetical protein QFC22_002306 [Naganishia vaughanmartiniae]
MSAMNNGHSQGHHVSPNQNQQQQSATQSQSPFPGNMNMGIGSNINLNGMQLPPGIQIPPGMEETFRRQLMALQGVQGNRQVQSHQLQQRRESGSHTPGTIGNGMSGMSMGGQTGMQQQQQYQQQQQQQQQGSSNAQLPPPLQADKQRHLAHIVQQLHQKRMQQAAYLQQQQMAAAQGQAQVQGPLGQGQAQGDGQPQNFPAGLGAQNMQYQPSQSPHQQSAHHFPAQTQQQRPITPTTRLPPQGITSGSPAGPAPPQSSHTTPSLGSAQNPNFQMNSQPTPNIQTNTFFPPDQTQTISNPTAGFPTGQPRSIPNPAAAAATPSRSTYDELSSRPNKRARYKVEYHPLSRDLTTSGGWDIPHITHAREKQSRYYRPLEVEDLGKIDIEGLCMSLRSGLAHEVSYALTALAMLSMPGKGNDKGGLGLAHCGDLLSDLVDLVDLNVFGEPGWAGWQEGLRERKEEEDEDTVVPDSPASGDSARLAKRRPTRDDKEPPPKSTVELLLQVDTLSAATLREAAAAEARSYSTMFDPDVCRTLDRYKKRVQTSLVAINLLRNFSMMSDNFGPMTTYPELMECLLRACDLRLAQIPPSSSEDGTDSDESPAVFLLLDILRIRHDVLDTIMNLANDLDLSKLSSYTQQAIFDLLNSYILDIQCINPSHRFTDVLFSGYSGGRLVPARTEWAIEALTRIITRDCNRRCLRQLSTKSIMASFQTLLRYLPLSVTDGYSINHAYTAASEILLRVVFCLYSLAWMSPLPVRAALREQTDAIATLSLAVRRLMTLPPHPTSTIILRRLVAVLGALNGADELASDGGSGVSGAAGAGAGKGTISFSANASIRGISGWKDASHSVQPGLLAGQEDLLTDLIMLANAQGVMLDRATVDELEKVIWVRNSP